MNLLSDIREIPDKRRLISIFALAAVLWCAAAVAVLRASALNDRMRASASAGSQIINSAVIYKLSGSAAPAKSAGMAGEEPLTVLSDIVNTLGLRERMTQMQSNVTGISLQLERLYGNELREFLMTIESRGLRIKTAELRALPVGMERLLSVSLLLDRG